MNEPHKHLYHFFFFFFSGSNFVTRKISRSVAKIHLGQLESFSLGNLDSKRDWGHAGDYVKVEHDLTTNQAARTHTHKTRKRPTNAHFS